MRATSLHKARSIDSSAYDRLQDRSVILAHDDVDRLGAPAPLERRDLEVDGFEAGDSQEVPAEGGGPLDRGLA